MYKINDLTSGKIFGKLMLTGKSYIDNKRRYVEVICECDNIKWMRFDVIKRNPLISCGCVNNERLRTNKPAVTHGLRKHPLYNVYRGVLNRCYDEKQEAYKLYGALGVVMCEEWKAGFINFYNWAIDKWEVGLELDKDILYCKKFGTKTGYIYSPEYCCFVSKKNKL